VPFELKVGVTPLMAFPKASEIKIVTPAVSTPFAFVGVVALIVEVSAEAGPGIKVIIDPALTTGLAIERVLSSAFVEVNVQVEIPLVLVAEHVLGVLFDPEAVKVGTIPTTALLVESFKVMVTVKAATPFAMTGPVPVIDEFAATAEPDWKITVPPVFTTGVLMERVLVSPVVEASVHVETPAVVEDEQVP
jgi:hypothetical protein